jgi:hypothetical protein
MMFMDAAQTNKEITMSKLVKVRMNRWGNYVCFIGTKRDRDTGEEFVAKCWLAQMLKEGYKISPVSDFSESDVESYKQWV